MIGIPQQHTDGEIYMIALAVMVGLGLAIIVGGTLLAWLEAVAYERDKVHDLP